MLYSSRFEILAMRKQRKEWFMQIIRNEEMAYFTFAPTDEEEVAVLQSVIALAKPKDRIKYGGRSGGDDGVPFMIFLHVDSQTEEVKEVEGNVTLTSYRRVGGVKLVLRGTTEADDAEVRRIRDAIYFGAGGAIFLGSCEVDGKTAIMVTLSHCKLCNAPMIDLSSCEWKTCKACAAKCGHQYERGAVHGGSAGDIGMGEFCNLCGRGKPEPESMRTKGWVERGLEVERELGMMILDKSTGARPKQVARVQRVVRNLSRARARV
jgi:hypothetical protein